MRRALSRLALNSLGPRSLAGQLALLVDIALFVAQAINFALLLGERRERRLNQLVVPAIVRLVNAADRFERGGMRPRARAGRARRVDVGERSGVTDAMARQPEIEGRIRTALDDAGIGALAIRAAEGGAGRWRAIGASAAGEGLRSLRS